eukprot:scaffold14800_cov163-Isochrysis_galbana.AAC.1
MSRRLAICLDMERVPQRHRVPSVPGGTRISVYWTEEPAGWFQATVVRSRKGSETKKKLVRLKKPRLPSALGLSGACGVVAYIYLGLP